MMAGVTLAWTVLLVLAALVQYSLLAASYDVRGRRSRHYPEWALPLVATRPFFLTTFALCVAMPATALVANAVLRALNVDRGSMTPSYGLAYVCVTVTNALIASSKLWMGSTVSKIGVKAALKAQSAIVAATLGVLWSVHVVISSWLAARRLGESDPWGPAAILGSLVVAVFSLAAVGVYSRGKPKEPSDSLRSREGAPAAGHRVHGMVQASRRGLVARTLAGVLLALVGSSIVSSAVRAGGQHGLSVGTYLYLAWGGLVIAACPFAMVDVPLGEVLAKLSKKDPLGLFGLLGSRDDAETDETQTVPSDFSSVAVVSRVTMLMLSIVACVVLAASNTLTALTVSLCFLASGAALFNIESMRFDRAKTVSSYTAALGGAFILAVAMLVLQAVGAYYGQPQILLWSTILVSFPSLAVVGLRRLIMSTYKPSQRRNTRA